MGTPAAGRRHPCPYRRPPRRARALLTGSCRHLLLPPALRFLQRPAQLLTLQPRAVLGRPPPLGCRLLLRSPLFQARSPGAADTRRGHGIAGAVARAGRRVARGSGSRAAAFCRAPRSPRGGGGQAQCGLRWTERPRLLWESESSKPCADPPGLLREPLPQTCRLLALQRLLLAAALLVLRPPPLHHLLQPPLRLQCVQPVPRRLLLRPRELVFRARLGWGPTAGFRFLSPALALRNHSLIFLTLPSGCGSY